MRFAVNFAGWKSCKTPESDIMPQYHHLSSAGQPKAFVRVDNIMNNRQSLHGAR